MQRHGPVAQLGEADSGGAGRDGRGDHRGGAHRSAGAQAHQLALAPKGLEGS